LNCGCPIDVVCNRGSGSALLNKPQRLIEIITTMGKYLPSRSVTVKVRTGWNERTPTTHKLIPMLQEKAPDNLAAIFIHGRSRLQRYSKLANWEYILQCAQSQDPSKKCYSIIGNGDIFSYEDWKNHQQLLADNIGMKQINHIDNNNHSESWQGNPQELLGLCSCAMIGRGALIKPWLPQELKEQRVIDISATERFDMLKRFCNYGLEHWGSDDQGVTNTRRFLLEWLSFLHRYVPAGITEHIQKMNQRPSPYFGRGELETMLSSPSASEWIKLSEMLLGKVPDNFNFVPKHKSNAYESDLTSNG
jgi:tRNA-dihydrouridine synthase 3